MPSLPVKSSAIGSNSASTSPFSPACCIFVIVSRNACSGGVRLQPADSSAQAKTKAASKVRLRGLPRFGAYAPIGSSRRYASEWWSAAGERNPGMSIERPWLANYPANVPAQVNVDEYPSIVSVLEQACESFRDNPAFTNFGTALSYGDIDRLSARFAAYLLGELQLKKGDRVALMMPNVLQYPIAIFGVLRAGLTVVNVNPMYTPRELKHQLRDSGAKAIVVMEMFAHVLAEVIADTPVQRVVTTCVGDLLAFPKGAVMNFVLRHVKRVIPEYRLPNAIGFRQALELGEQRSLPQIEIRPEDIAFLQYT